MLREYRKDDLKQINQFTLDGDVTRGLSNIFMGNHTLERTESFLQYVLTYGGNDAVFWIIAEKETGDYLGQIDVSAIDWTSGIGTLGIVIADCKNHGRGIGTQALALLLDYCFSRMGLRKVELLVFTFNRPGVACYRACGFRVEGKLREQGLRDGRWQDMYRMGVFAREFYASTAANKYRDVLPGYAPARQQNGQVLPGASESPQTYQIPQGFRISQDPGDIDTEKLYTWLSQQSYWARERTREVFQRSLEGSTMVFIVLDPGGSMAGFARVVSDGATMYWVGDLVIFPEFRAQGLGKALCQEITRHPDLTGLTGLLSTADAHGLYQRFGFEETMTTLRKAP